MNELQDMAEGLGAQLRAVGDEDAVQEGFLRMSLRRDRQPLANPSGYWFRASRNALVERQRQRDSEERAIAHWLEIEWQSSEPPRWSDDQLARLRRGIDQLQGKRRRLIDLELGGVHKGARLAEALGISEGAVRTLRHRTYRQLRSLLAA